MSLYTLHVLLDSNNVWFDPLAPSFWTGGGRGLSLLCCLASISVYTSYHMQICDTIICNVCNVCWCKVVGGLIFLLHRWSGCLLEGRHSWVSLAALAKLRARCSIRNTSAHAHAHAHAHSTCTHKCIHTFSHAHTHFSSHAHTHILAHSYMHPCNTHAHTHTFTHAHTYIYTHTYTWQGGEDS